jgi:hypothetical protein
MFMRYNHLGVGHSATLRKIIKCCLGSVSVALTDSIDNVIEGNEGDVGCDEAGDGEGHEYDYDLDLEDNEECDEEELSSDEELDEGAIEDGDGDGCDEDGDDDYDHISF